MFTYAGISTRGPYAGLGFRHHHKSRRRSSGSATKATVGLASYVQAKRNLDSARERMAVANENAVRQGLAPIGTDSRGRSYTITPAQWANGVRS